MSNPTPFIMKLPKDTEIKKCIICEKEFIRAKKGKRSKQSKISIRSSRTQTCSTKCSKVYVRVKNHIRRSKEELQYQLKMEKEDESKVF